MRAPGAALLALALLAPAVPAGASAVAAGVWPPVAMAPRPNPSSLPTPAPSPSPTPAPARVTLTPARSADGVVWTVASDAGFAAETRASDDRLTLLLRQTGPAPRPWDAAGVSRIAADPILGAPDASIDPDGALRVTWAWRYRALPDLAVDTATQARLIVRTRFETVEERPLARGVVQRTYRSADGLSPLTAYALVVDPAEPGVRLEVAVAEDPATRRPSRAPVSRLVQAAGAVAGVNGAYFAAGGAATGLLVVRNEWIAQPYANRTALAWGPGAGPWMETAAWPMRLETPSGERYDIDAFNAPRGLNRLACYTERWGSTSGQPDGYEVALEPDGRVRSAGLSNTPIPPGGYLLSAHGQAAGWLSRVASVGAVLKPVNPYPRLWPGARYVLGSGPRLLADGQVALTDVLERFQADIREGRKPRTAVGLLPDGRWLIAVVDGRFQRHSRGMTLLELARWLQAQGARDAINLDGGGSSAFAVGGKLLNRPSDGVERPVANALVVHAAFDVAPEVAAPAPAP